jgi:glucosyl-3-phosphoglycerate synthase
VRVLSLIAARNEAGRVGGTVQAVRAIDAVDEVVVVDGSSRDGTPEEARRAGARVLVAPAAGGKGASLDGALDRVGPADVYLFLDADLEETAVEGEKLVAAVADGRADLAIGALPRQEGHGGFRLVKRTAAATIRALCGFSAIEPLSGQRAVAAAVLPAVRPLAPGFGVEVAMTVDAVRAGFRVVEIPVAMRHAVTGRDVAGFAHRGNQGWDLLRAAGPRVFRRR